MGKPSSIEQAVAVLACGEPVIFPTDTVYGLGVAVEVATSPDILFDLKGRERGKPVAWLVSGVSDLSTFGKEVPEVALVAARIFWPGPLTLIVQAGERVPESFRSPKGTIGLRMPDSETALRLMCAVGSPLATTSANLSGCEAPRSLSALDSHLTERVGAVVSDTSDAKTTGVASTVIDCTQGDLRLVREGALSLAGIQEQVLHELKTL